MEFSLFATHLFKLESTSSRLGMTEQLATLFTQLDSDEVQPACYLMQGTLVPLYQSLEFQMSVKMVIRALAHMTTSQANSAKANTSEIQEDLFGDQVTEKQIDQTE
jgi:septation ring formation regulator EzrA